MSRESRLVLAACCLAILAVGENSTAIMAALPAMTSDLHLSPATVEWVVNAYLLASSSVAKRQTSSGPAAPQPPVSRCSRLPR